jgi:crotonobetainyl-CoA:carnitine CoA-transferase CaiB-like acyl-CoA transferase
MEAAFEGIKVIDTAINYAGPTISTYLADQGADVIKVERRGVGDTSRRSGNTPFLKLNSRHFMAINRGKRSITVDITKPDGAQIIKDLARDADVFTDNFRPGVMDRLGIGYTALSELNPRLIWASLTAYGLKGPYSDKAGFNRMAEGLAGALFQKEADGRPRGPGIWIADWAAPMVTAFGIAAALYVRERTGRGQFVESSLLHASVAMQLGDLTIVEDDPTPPRQENPSGYGSFVCSDGVYINVGAFFQPQWKRLCKVLDVTHIGEDERFPDPIARNKLFGESWPVFDAIFSTRPSAEWIDALNEADVPCAPIVDRPNVRFEPQIIENELMVEVDHPVVGKTHIAGTAVHLSENPSVKLKPAPWLGQHTDEILGELGYSPERIAELRAAEVI